jgi:hypothetical protein
VIAQARDLDLKSYGLGHGYKRSKGMLYWLFERVLRRAFKSRKDVLVLDELESLARAGTAGWLMAQEQARLRYLAAMEKYQELPHWGAFEVMMKRLLELQSTSAVVQSLLNEHFLNQLLLKSADLKTAPAETRKVA